jgi:hypothetical protein
MIELRDGEVAVWCRCRRRFAAPSLAAALASGHHCGGGPNPALGGVGRAAALQGGGLSGRTACDDNDVRGRDQTNEIKRELAESRARPRPPITVPTAVDNLAAPTRPRRHLTVTGTTAAKTVAPVLARTRGNVKSS